MSTSTIIHPNPVCPQCGCKSTAKKGKRRNRLQTLQVYRCTDCLHRFTGEAGKNKAYPLRLILEAVSTFNLGHSITETQQLMRRRFHRQIPERTSAPGSPNTGPHDVLTPARKVYRFQVHRAKLELLTQPTPQPDTRTNLEFSVLKKYLASIEDHVPTICFKRPSIALPNSPPRFTHR